MSDDWRAVIGAFDGECAVLLEVLSTLHEAEFARETNCPPWSLHELVVHICYSACTLPVRLAEPEPTAPVVSAADYYRRADRATDSYRTGNVVRTQRAALRHPTPQDAVAAVDAAWERAKPQLEALDPNRRIAGPANVARDGDVLLATAITLRDFYITRLIALAAHAVDVALTLDRPCWTTPAAAAVVAPTLLDLLGGDDPTGDLGWDDATFLAAATGRRPLTSQETVMLGHRGERFPLLS